tara:strand:- start:210 stop:779 length:570 start_codon:yes stop_codon:yes gene_type:complete
VGLGSNKNLMIIFDDFLPDSTLKTALADDEWWRRHKNGVPITWTFKNKPIKNPIEHLCDLVWTQVAGITPILCGWEYWGHNLNAQNVTGLPFHYDTNIKELVPVGEEERRISNGTAEHAYKGFIYYCHTELPEGGYLELEHKDKQIERIQSVPNRLIIFDTSLKHRVTAVTAGVRRSIVSNAWQKDMSK